MTPAIDDRLMIDPPPLAIMSGIVYFDAKEYASSIDRHEPVPGFGAVNILFGATGDAGIAISAIPQRSEYGLR